ncbi:hypothetical protein CIRG_09936 [Coccidioides immitis RMSCC 2394]|uniref:Uncharacterized protein n=1 Tax=Coccidioides immitis RMSCC 2394 TaxID=404692 RepID=A0A0J6YR19_COCIT|nr:hypothetical protein CIRG_09936 [Coccidioides immitis RMSCC 2394]
MRTQLQKEFKIDFERAGGTQIKSFSVSTEAERLIIAETLTRFSTEFLARDLLLSQIFYFLLDSGTGDPIIPTSENNNKKEPDRDLPQNFDLQYWNFYLHLFIKKVFILAEAGVACKEVNGWSVIVSFVIDFNNFCLFSLVEIQKKRETQYRVHTATIETSTTKNRYRITTIYTTTTTNKAKEENAMRKEKEERKK